MSAANRNPVRSRAVLAGLLVLVLTGLGLVWLWPTTGQDPTNPDRGPATADAGPEDRSFEVFLAQVVARPAGQVVLAPATEQWWEFITAFAHPLELGPDELPADAAWVGYSYTEATDQAATPGGAHTVYFGFDDEEAAARFAADATHGPQHRFPVSSGAVAALSTTPETLPTQLTADGITPQSGHWQTTPHLWASIHELTYRFPGAFSQFVANLGAPTGATWTATSDQPWGDWTGTLDGHGPVDVEDALRVLRGTTDEQADEAMDLDLAIRLITPGFSYGKLPTDHTSLPDETTLMMGAFDAPGVDFAIARDAHPYPHRLGVVAFTLTNDGTLTLTPTKK